MLVITFCNKLVRPVAGADLTGGHSRSGRRGRPHGRLGLGGPRKAKFWLAIAKS